MRVLVIDVGGSKVKFAIFGGEQSGDFHSSKVLTAASLVRRVKKQTVGWPYDVISIGLPGPVVHGKAIANPPNLGHGWVGFDFQKHFGKPVKLMNDAAMQALGSYEGGRMLFLGLGTGVGSALILDDVIIPLELGELRYSDSRTLSDVIGKSALKKCGPRRWEKIVHCQVQRLAKAFRTDYVVIGGGNVEKLKRLPHCARRGSNDNAILGGARLWGRGTFRARPKKHTWVIT
jgi:polyphosphate glucokinase